MRIGLVVPGFSASAGDWCIPALRHLVQRLAETDDVRVLALRYPYQAARYDVFGAEVNALGGGQRRGRRVAALWGRGLAALANEHRRRRFDVLHAFWANETGALTALAGRLLGIPTVVSLAGGEPVGLPEIRYGGRLAWQERCKSGLALRLAATVTGGSRYQLELAFPNGRGPAGVPIRRVPLGIDTTLFRPCARRTAGSPPRLIHVASLSPVKDQSLLLRAIAELDRRGHPVELDIVGDGPLEQELRRAAEQSGLTGRVRFLGAVAHHALPSLYRRADLYVHASRHEAQGMTILEAAACGLPIVGTRVGVVPELEDGCAIGVEARTPAAFADALASLIDRPDALEAMGRAAHARVETEFGLARSVDRFRRVYAILAAGSHRPTHFVGDLGR
jgi:glycosyltransferase involved in cell wall biosynthesis